jgi:predicted dehydrogenase
MEMQEKSDCVWLIGTGLMGVEYAKVLKELNIDFVVIGRGQANADKFQLETGIKPIIGGLSLFLSRVDYKPEKVIIAVGIENLAEICCSLIRFGIKQILLEKPGFAYPTELKEILTLKQENEVAIYLAYNRRFYESVRKAKELIMEDGGVVSFSFEFTEWSHIVGKLKKDKAEHNTWFLGNSTHVIDTAFYLAGEPVQLTAYVGGGLEWHPSSSIFSGAGITKTNALFSYQANWEGPGRWSIDIVTKKRRLIFRPIETLQIQEIGSINIIPIELNDKWEKIFKPGLFLQVNSFLNNQVEDFCTLEYQANIYNKYYARMSGYDTLF